MNPHLFDMELTTGNLKGLSIPERSLLFALAPVESPPAQRESLISLLIRTSGAHALNPRRLIAGVLAKTNPQVATLVYPSFFNRLSGTINGHGKYADLFVQGLENLTGQQGLSRLTLLPWKDFFPHNGQGMLSRHPRWCSACLLEQRRSREDIYFPLLWSLEAYRHCSIHGRPLDDHCPHCGKRQPFLSRYPDQAVCHHCLRSLIAMPAVTAGDRGAAVSPFDTWVATAVGAMLAQHGAPAFAPSADQFRAAIRAMVQSLAGGNRAAFCRAIGFDKYALKNWFAKGERPSITQFLALSYALQGLPSTILAAAGDISARTPVPLMRQPGKLKVRKRCPKVSAQRRAELGRFLQAMLRVEPPQPVSALAAGYGVTAQYLRYHFPELCAQLSKRHQQCAKQRAASRSDVQRIRAQEIVGTLRSANSYPSRRKVDAILRKEGISLANRDVFSAYRAALVA